MRCIARSVILSRFVAASVDNAGTAGVLDGTLAPDLLRNFDVEFDFASHTMNLFRPHSCDGKAAYWTGQYIAIPMEITPAGHTRVDVTLDGETRRRILVDTPARLFGT